MRRFFLKEKIKIEEVIIFGFLFFVSVFLFSHLTLAQGTTRNSQYKIEDSYVEIQKGLSPQEIVLTKKENGQENISGKFKVIDDYLISDIPEDEFLDKYNFLKNGFKDLKITIEIDQPFFNKEKFYQPKSLFQKIESLFSNEKLPDYRLAKEINDTGEALETNFGTPELNFKTAYKLEEGRIKQGLFLSNNSEKEINFQLSFIHSIESSRIFFGGNEYEISESPQFLSPEISSLVYFYPNAPESDDVSVDIGSVFGYDFSDLSKFNPEIWVFKKDNQYFLLVKSFILLAPNSSITIDPLYTIGTSSGNTATRYSHQRKTWWDGTRYWAAYYDSAAPSRLRVFYIQADAANWTENQNASCTDVGSDFSIYGNNTKAFMAYASGTRVLVREATTTYPGQTFKWTNPGVVVGPITSAYPSIAIASDGRVWTTFRHHTSTSNYEFVARQSTNVGSIAAWASTSPGWYNLDNGSSSNKFGVVVQYATSGALGKVYVIWVEDVNISGKMYTSFGWGTTANIASTTSGTTENMQAVSNPYTLDVHLVYGRLVTPIDTLYYKRWVGVEAAWTTSVALSSNTSVNSQYYAISMNTSTNDLYIFWENETTSSFIITYSSGSSPYARSNWGASTSWESTTTGVRWLSSNLWDDSKIYAIWSGGSGAPYPVLWKDISVGNAVPSVGTVILNSGNNINLTESVTTTVSATATVTDSNGYNNISSVIGKIYRSAVGTGCSDEDNSCYSDALCATSSCSGYSCTATCSYDVWFHADPTDASSTVPTQYWAAWMKAIDVSNASGTATSTAVEMNTLYGFDAGSLLRERSGGAEDGTYAAYDINWLAQTFRVGGNGQAGNHNINYVKVYMDRWGNSGTTTLSIRDTVGDVPSDVDLASTSLGQGFLPLSGGWVLFPLSPFELSQGVMYAIVLRAPYAGGLVNNIEWSADSADPPYEAGQAFYSNESGRRWEAYFPETDFLFEEYGDGGIGYGTFMPLQDTGTLDERSLLFDTGNSAFNIYLQGDDMTSNGNILAVRNQEYATSELSYGLGVDLRTDIISVKVDLAKPVSHPSTSTDDIYWGIGIPTGQAAGTYNGINTFTPF